MAVVFIMDENSIDLCHRNAVESSYGGMSNVRGDSDDRMATLLEDQMVGQMVNYVGSVVLTGSSEPYIQSREEANRRGRVGDNGEDLPGYRIDFKGSLMRKSRNPWTYNLLVRPSEVHDGEAYVLGLVPSILDGVVIVMGWLPEYQLPPVTKGGIFSGAHVVRADRLLSISHLKKRVHNFKSLEVGMVEIRI